MTYYEVSEIVLNNKRKHFFQTMGWFVGFFVEWHINLCELLNAKTILIEEQ